MNTLNDLRHVEEPVLSGDPKRLLTTEQAEERLFSALRYRINLGGGSSVSRLLVSNAVLVRLALRMLDQAECFHEHDLPLIEDLVRQRYYAHTKKNLGKREFPWT